MSGPEHYQEAERLLATANQRGNANSAHEDRLTARAQVHATLALAAATGLMVPENGYGEGSTWRAVALPGR